MQMTYNLPPHKTRRYFLAAAVAALLTALAVRLDVSEWLRGGFGWRWPYVPLDVMRMLPLMLLAAGYVVGAWLLLRRAGRALPVIAWSVLGTLVLALGALAAREGDLVYALFARTASALGSGQHWAAGHLDWANGAWRNWSGQITALGGHLSNLPPGSVMWYGLLSGLLDQVPVLAETGQRALMPLQCHNDTLHAYTPGQWTSALFGMAMPLWAALTPIVLYPAARQIAPPNARAVVLWYPLIPALGAFAGTWNTLYPFIALLAMLALLHGTRAGRTSPGWIFASGFITGTAWFINFALVPLALLFGVWVLVGEWLVKRRPLLSCIHIGMVFAAGLVMIWGAFWLVTQQTPLDLLRAGMSFHVTLDRPYAFWVVMHTWDWLLWGGLPFGVAAALHLAAWLRSRTAAHMGFPVMGATLTLTILILVISGTARGETARVWLYFAPFLLLAAGEILQREESPVGRSEWLWLALPQAVLFLALISSIAAMSTEFTLPPQPSGTNTANTADARFTSSDGGVFTLTGWDAEISGSTLTLRFNWEGLAPSLSPIWFGGVLVGPDGTTIPLEAWQPGGGVPYPTTCWAAGTRVGDVRTVSVGDDLRGEWWLSLAAYGDISQPYGRLTVHTAAGDDMQVGLGPIRHR